MQNALLLVAEIIKQRTGLKEIFYSAGIICFALGIARLFGIDFARGQASSIDDPLMANVALLMLAAGMICCGQITEFISSMIARKNSLAENLIEYERDFGGMTALEKQLRFKALFGIAPDVREIEIIFGHRNDPSNTISSFVHAHRLVRLEEGRFVYTLKNPIVGQILLFVFSATLSLYAAVSLALGAILIVLGWQDSVVFYKALVQFFAGIAVIVPALSLSNEVLAIASARRLIAMLPEKDTGNSPGTQDRNSKTQASD